MKIDTVLIDTNVLVHLLYNNWDPNIPMETYVRLGVESYNKLPFILEKVGKILWVSDGKPYFRRRIYRTYKGNRPEKDELFEKFAKCLYDLVNPLTYPYFEADDLIAHYIKNHPEKRIMILSVDSDLLQLLREKTEEQEEVFWCCAAGKWPPQVRSIANGGLKVWLSKKLDRSKKKLGDLDPNNPKSIVEWKVRCGDKSDNIPAGEASRDMIDLLNPPAGWVLTDHYETFLEDCAQREIDPSPCETKHQVYVDFVQKTGYYFPTRPTY